MAIFRQRPPNQRAKSRGVGHIGGATLGQTCHSQKLEQDLHS
jgi:hypothetical protein